MKLIIQSAGNEDGNIAGLYLNDGDNLYQPARGINYIKFDESSLEVMEQQVYNTYDIQADAGALYDMLTDLDHASDHIICLAVMDTAETHLNTPVNGSSVTSFLTAIGSKYIGELSYRDSWAMLFKKQDGGYQVLFEGYRPRNRGMVQGAPMVRGYIRFREGIDSDEDTSELDIGVHADAQTGIRNHVGYIAENINEGAYINAPLRVLPPSWHDPRAFVAQQQTIAIDAGPNFIVDQAKVAYELYRDEVLIHTFEAQQPQKYFDENRVEHSVYEYHMRTLLPKNGVFISGIRQKDIMPQPKLVRFNQFTGRVAWDDVLPPLGGDIRYELIIDDLRIIKAMGEAKAGYTVFVTSSRFTGLTKNSHGAHTHHTVSWLFAWGHKGRHTHTHVHHHELTTHKTHNKHLEHLAVAPNTGHELTHHGTNAPGQGYLPQVTHKIAGHTVVTEEFAERTIQDAASRATDTFYSQPQKLIEQQLLDSFWDVPAYGLSNVAIQYKGMGTVLAKRKIDPDGDWTPANVEYSIVGIFANG